MIFYHKVHEEGDSQRNTERYYFFLCGTLSIYSVSFVVKLSALNEWFLSNRG